MNVNISNAALLILEGILLLKVILLNEVVVLLHYSSLLSSPALSFSTKSELVMPRRRRPDLATLRPLKSAQPRHGCTDVGLCRKRIRHNAAAAAWSRLNSPGHAAAWLTSTKVGRSVKN